MPKTQWVHNDPSPPPTISEVMHRNIIGANIGVWHDEGLVCVTVHVDHVPLSISSSLEPIGVATSMWFHADTEGGLDGLSELAAAFVTAGEQLERLVAEIECENKEACEEPEDEGMAGDEIDARTDRFAWQDPEGAMDRREDQ